MVQSIVSTGRKQDQKLAQPQMRRFMLFGGLALTIALSVWAERQPDESEEIAIPARSLVKTVKSHGVSAADTNSSSSSNQTLRLLDWTQQRVSQETEAVNPFMAKSWFVAPPPPPPSAPAVPMPPSAPPFPYVYAGKIDIETDDGVKQLYYIASGDKQLTLTAGERFEKVYVFEGVEGSNLVIQYEPLALRQYVPMNRN